MTGEKPVDVMASEKIKNMKLHTYHITNFMRAIVIGEYSKKTGKNYVNK